MTGKTGKQDKKSGLETIRSEIRFFRRVKENNFAKETAGMNTAIQAKARTREAGKTA